jgi:hypothetical protein
MGKKSPKNSTNSWVWLLLHACHPRTKRVEGVAQVVDYLRSKYKALSSNPSNTKNKTKQKTNPKIEVS